MLYLDFSTAAAEYIKWLKKCFKFNSTGVFWRQLMTNGGAELESWNYLAVCVPIVVIFAPFGSFMSSFFHRQVLAFLIYFLDTIALVSK